MVYDKLAVAFEAGKNLFLKYSLENFYNELPIQLEFFLAINPGDENIGLNNGVLRYCVKISENTVKYFWWFKNSSYVCIRNGDDLPRYPGF